MFELTEINPPVDVPDFEYQRLLGYPPNHLLEEPSRELAAATRAWYGQNGRPWIYAREMDGLELQGGNLRIAGVDFSATPLYDSFAAARVHSAVLVAVSAGRECEARARQLWQESKPDEYFFMEMFGSSVVEHLVTIANGRICGWADANAMVALPHYSPGYSGWDIADQVNLLNLLRKNAGAGFPGDLDVLESGMLRPKKSLLAVVGVTRRRDLVSRRVGLVPCENCSLPGCQYRRTPYLRARTQLESVPRLQSTEQVTGSAVPGNGALVRNAKYSVNLRALQKWSQERLRLTFLPDGTVAAHFRYEGTTCSSQGRALLFDYHVKLGSADERYKIVETSCVPAPDDTGHAQQCEYLKDAASLMLSLAGEKPLSGKPLDDVLLWVRAPSPSGCFCDSERRDHKWGLVFEVIHYALSRREIENGTSAAS